MRFVTGFICVATLSSGLGMQAFAQGTADQELGQASSLVNEAPSMMDSSKRGDASEFNAGYYRGWHRPNRGAPIPIPIPVPVPYPPPYPAPAPSYFQCNAQDAYGHQFFATGYNRFQTQQQALNECIQSSNYGCAEGGCVLR